MSLSQHSASGKPPLAKTQNPRSLQALGQSADKHTYTCTHTYSKPLRKTQLLISARSFGRPRRLVGIHVGDFASASRRAKDTRTAGLAGARLEHYSGLGTGHLRTRGRNRSMEGHRADPAQVRKVTHPVLFLFIIYLSIYLFIYFLVCAEMSLGRRCT
jgi:hypothetical protein